MERELVETRRARQAAPVQERADAQPATAAPTAEPKLKDYLARHPGDEAEALSKWVSDRDAWRDTNRQREAAQHAQVEERRRAVGQAVDGFMGRLNKAAEADETFKERTGVAQPLFGGRSIPEVLQPSFTLPRDEHGQMQGLEGRHVVADEVLKSEMGPAMIEHFSDNPEDLQRIAALQTPAEIQRAMAKLEARLEDDLDAAIADTSSRREVSKAGTPARSVAGSPHTAAPDIHGDMDFETFMSRKRARKS